jgi:hypothetical protein
MARAFDGSSWNPEERYQRTIKVRIPRLLKYAQQLGGVFIADDLPTILRGPVLTGAADRGLIRFDGERWIVVDRPRKTDRKTSANPKG